MNMLHETAAAIELLQAAVVPAMKAAATLTV